MDIIVETIGPVAISTPRADQLDASNADEFKADMAPVLDRYCCVVCDLSEMTFLDSAGLGALLSCLRRVGGGGGDLKLCSVSDPVRSVLRITRMHRIFDIFETREEAIRAFGD